MSGSLLGLSEWLTKGFTAGWNESKCNIVCNEVLGNKPRREELTENSKAGGRPCWGHEENWAPACWSKPLTLVSLCYTSWILDPANLCCPGGKWELRGVETTLAHVVQNLLWRTRPCLTGLADVGRRVGLRAGRQKSREGWGNLKEQHCAPKTKSPELTVCL